LIAPLKEDSVLEENAIGTLPSASVEYPFDREDFLKRGKGVYFFP
jgi:hypothetical protein